MKKTIIALFLMMAMLLTGLAFSENAPDGDSFVGRWGCGRATLDIERGEGDRYDVTIQWANSAAEESVWRYVCAFNGEQLKSAEPGTLDTVTYGEDGEIASTQGVYADGAASFAINAEGLLIWDDKKENAGADMAFERGIEAGLLISGDIAEGGYEIRIPTEEGDEGWKADDMAQDDSVVRLAKAEIIDGIYTVRYEPVSDGDVTVTIRHMNGIACDKLMTWDLHIEGGAVQEVTGGSQTQSPSEEELNPIISGEWLVNDHIMAGLTIEKNEDQGFKMQIATAEPAGSYVFAANLLYDCELDELVYDDCTVYESEITSSPEIVYGDVIQENVSGSVKIVGAEDGEIQLEWHNELSPQETALFHRPRG